MMRKIVFLGSSFDDFIDWLTIDRAIYLKIAALIEETRRTPYEGKGSPEPLKHQLAGMWSRRINHEHRLVYIVTNESLEIVSCRYHYNRT